jgi:hypothetical protein
LLSTPALSRNDVDRGANVASGFLNLPLGLTAILAIAGVLVVAVPSRVLTDGLVTDDAFYALTVARQIGTGHGVTIDGARVTNGFQPLWVFLCAPLFAVVGGDRLAGLRLVTALSSVIWIATALVLARVVSRAIRDSADARARRRAFAIAATLYLSNGLAFLLHFNGLETGLVLLLLALTARYLQSHDLATRREQIVLGAWLGLDVLARIDAVFVVGVVALYVFVASRAPVGERVRRAAVPAIVAAIVSLPWFAFGWLRFHALMPSSGEAQLRYGITAPRLRSLFDAVVTDLVPLTPLPNLEGAPQLSTLRWLLLAAGFAWAIVHCRRIAAAILEPHREKSASLRGSAVASIALSSFAALGAYYVFASYAAWHYLRYLASGLLIGIGFAAVVVSALWRKHAAVAAVLLVALCFAVPAQVWLWHRPFGAARDRVVMMDPAHAWYSYAGQLALVEAHVPPGDLVGALQSGTLGFFRDRVLNLDGKVNADVLEYKRRTPKGVETRAYIDRAGVGWICDWEVLVRAALGDDPQRSGWRRVAEDGPFVLYRRD